jgi:hypothetical protein
MMKRAMSQMEQSALGHAAEWLRYQSSPKAAKDLAKDKAKRATADKATGHSPKCSLTNCHPECKH